MKTTSAPCRASDFLLDPETLQLIKNRDSHFLSQLFSDVNPYLMRVCAASGIYDIDAEEVIFDTWDRFFTNLEQFQGRSQIRTFICGILFNKIREHRRAIGRTTYEEDAEKVLNRPFTEDGWWKQEPRDPFKLYQSKQVGSLIKDCIDGLTDQQKNAFLMREVEEENSDEICNVLDINVSHLRVLLFRAKEKLRKCLEGKVSLEEA